MRDVPNPRPTGHLDAHRLYPFRGKGFAMTVSYPITIFYDGACGICSREMRVFRKRNPEQAFRFLDISAPTFDPLPYRRPLEAFFRQLHVRDSAGRFYIGISALTAIWRAFPRHSFFRALAFVVSLPGFFQLAGLGYALFAKYRYRFSGNHRACPVIRHESE